MPPPSKAGRVIAGGLLIIVGSIIALPAGLCTGIALTAGEFGAMGMGLVAALVAALGGSIVWAGCRIAVQDRSPGRLFSGVIAVLILLALMFMMWLTEGLR